MRNIQSILGIIILGIFVFINCETSTESDPDPENKAPTIISLTANPDTVSPDEMSELTCIADDPDDDSLTYVWECNSGSINGSGNTVNWLALDVIGNYSIMCKVLDGNGG